MVPTDKAIGVPLRLSFVTISRRTDSRASDIGIETATLDRFCAAHAIDRIDVLKLDIQGGELAALRGAEGLLRGAAIRLVVAEVNFVPLYRDMPLFWDVAAYLRGLGYELHGLFDLHHRLDGSGALRWADAIFVPAGA